VKKKRGLFLFERNEKKNRRGTPTPKTPFAARFSFCATVDFNSILKYFPKGLWLQILYQNLWNLSNYWIVEKSRGLFLLKRNEKKNRRGTLTPKMPFSARFSFCATVDFISILKYFHAIKDNRTNLNSFELFFLFTLKFCAILDKNCSKRLHVKIEKVAKVAI